MQCFERLLDGRVVVPAVNLVQIDVVGVQPPKAGVDLRQDRLARQAAAVGILAHGEVDLGRNHHLVALGEVAQGSPHDFFAGAVGVGVGRIEEVDAAARGPGG